MLIYIARRLVWTVFVVGIVLLVTYIVFFKKETYFLTYMPHPIKLKITLSEVQPKQRTNLNCVQLRLVLRIFHDMSSFLVI